MFQGENMDGISVSDTDAKAGSPKAGDMIARNPETTRISGWSPLNTSLTTSRPRERSTDALVKPAPGCGVVLRMSRSGGGMAHPSGG